MTAANVTYVKALLHMPGDTPEHQIGVRVWKLARREDVLVYLNEVMADHPQDSRWFEIAWDVRALMPRGLKATRIAAFFSELLHRNDTQPDLNPVPAAADWTDWKPFEGGAQ